MTKSLKRKPKVSSTLHNLFHQGLKDLSKFLKEGETELLARTPLQELSEILKSKILLAVQHRESYLYYCALRQLEGLLSKNTDLPGTSVPSRKAAALQTFSKSEIHCSIVNKRLRYFSKHKSRMPIGVRNLLPMIQDIISDTMGSMGHLDFLKVVEHSGFGPGFTFSSTDQEHRHLYFKVAGPHSVTADALPYVKVFFQHSENWKQSLIEADAKYDIVRGNRITTVPKTAVTDRTIAIEPSFNVMIQKGVDYLLKGRLRHVGVTLTNQKRNHTIAKIASERPLFAATVDLSSASDSLTIEAARLLLPTFWFTLLDDLRSKEFTLDRGKSWHRYEKFSSMGNAFTFPVESLIFYAVAKACTIEAGGDLSVLRVYGDDIIIDPRAVLLLIEVLKFLGFVTNSDKTFCFGHFRETCGSDFLSGVDTRPVYVRRLPRNERECFNLFNRFLWNRVGFRLHNLCEYIHSLVARPLYGPPDLPAGENFLRWEAGKSIIYDDYFHAPPDKGDRFKRFDPDLQSTYWHIKVARMKPLHQDTSNWTLQLWYLTFLLGIPGTQRVDSVSRFRKIFPYVEFYRWVDLPWRPQLYDFEPYDPRT